MNVDKIYRTGTSEFYALKKINFELRHEEMLAIVGASGSGKSTLMNILGLLDHCTSGQYFFNGEEVAHLSEKQLAKIRNKKIGFVFQSFFLLPRLTALQNVMLPLSYSDIPLEIATEKAYSMLEKVHMEMFAQRKPNELSGGQQQRVAIARALVNDPQIILADEPTGALDSKTGQEVMNLLTKLHQQDQRTIVIITHDIKISQLCERTVVLQDGCIV